MNIIFKKGGHDASQKSNMAAKLAMAQKMRKSGLKLKLSNRSRSMLVSAYEKADPNTDYMDHAFTLSKDNSIELFQSQSFVDTGNYNVENEPLLKKQFINKFNVTFPISIMILGLLVFAFLKLA